MIELSKTNNAGASTPEKMDVVEGPPKTLQKMNQEKSVLPRFLVIKKKEGDFSKDSPFLINKLLFGIVGNLKSVRKSREGLIVETVSASQAGKLLRTKRLGETDVEVIAHQTLNVSRGVIYCRDLLNCTLEEIKEELQGQGVIDVKRIKTKIEGELKDTANHIVTFNTPKIPQNIKVAFYQNVPVRHYIPSPMRCFRCQKFGHTSAKCNGEQVCVCGKPLHEGQPCEDPVKCVNCQGNHSARSKNCPIYKQEAYIQELKVKENLPYLEAKRKAVPSTPAQGVSYARAVAAPTNIDVPALVKELIPALVTVLKSSFKVTPITQPIAGPPVFTIGSGAGDISSNSMDMDVARNTEKRKRAVKTLSTENKSQSGYSDEESSQSDVSKPEFRKPKKGWPKGKPRKPND